MDKLILEEIPIGSFIITNNGDEYILISKNGYIGDQAYGSSKPYIGICVEGYHNAWDKDGVSDIDDGYSINKVLDFSKEEVLWKSQVKNKRKNIFNKVIEPPKEEKQIDETSDVYRFAEWCYVNGIDFSFMSTTENPTLKRLQKIVSRYESETSKPKEEKQKIKHISLQYMDNIVIKDKINELIDVVNELRGVE